jgi:DNA-binding LytR/AlgR family response regulator
MKVIIIDDEAASIDALVSKLKTYDIISIEGTAQTGSKGIGLVQETCPDVVFLDVELPDISGLDFLGQMSMIQAAPCRVVIYTAHSQYMLSAFRNKAFDFLLKPIDDRELAKIVQRCLIEPAPQPASEQKDPERLILYTNATDFKIVNTNDTGLFSYNHEARVWEAVVAGNAEPLRLKRSVNNETLTAIDPRFIQVNQKHIVNINYLMEVSDGVCRFFPPFDKIDYVKVGRLYNKKLLERYNAL